VDATDSSPGAPRTGANRLRRPAAAALGVIVLLGAGIGGWLVLAPTSDGLKNAGDHPYVVAKVQRRDLTVGTTLDGILGYGAPKQIPIQASGIVTWLPKPGTKAVLGSVLLRVDDRPVVLLYGQTPAYRSLHAEGAAPKATPAATAGDNNNAAEQGTPGRDTAGGQPAADSAASEGPDVRQLENGLWALGYRGFTVDDVFTSGTTAAVKQWQADLGIAPTGVVELGDVVFLPGPVRLTVDASALGVALDPTAVQAQGLTKFVTVQVQDESDWTKAGTKVTIKLPDGREARGTVTATQRTSSAQADGSGGPTVQIAVDKNAPRAATGDVEVTYIAQQRKQVLAVPVTALVALAEGGYAVQLDSGRYVAVMPGLYADGMVEVTGNLTEGAEIRVPR
jgi:peptidoglycan hydrolase-like protein with peptidoglycan-binding domain